MTRPDMRKYGGRTKDKRDRSHEAEPEPEVPWQKVYVLARNIARAATGRTFYPFQEAIAQRVTRSVVENEGAEIAATVSRQAGKSDCIALISFGLANAMPLLGLEPIRIGVFGPRLEQARIIFTRVKDCFNASVSINGERIRLMEQLGVEPQENNGVTFKTNLGTSITSQSASPEAHVEGLTLDVIVCLPGDQRVLTDVGWVPIERVVRHGVGQKVLSWNHSTGQAEWRAITGRMQSPLAHRRLVEFLGPSVVRLRCTDNHPVFTDAGYRRADDINRGSVYILSPTDGVDASPTRWRPSQATILPPLQSDGAGASGLLGDALGRRVHLRGKRHVTERAHHHAPWSSTEGLLPMEIQRVEQVVRNAAENRGEPRPWQVERVLPDAQPPSIHRPSGHANPQGPEDGHAGLSEPALGPRRRSLVYGRRESRKLLHAGISHGGVQQGRVPHRGIVASQAMGNQGRSESGRPILGREAVQRRPAAVRGPRPGVHSSEHAIQDGHTSTRPADLRALWGHILSRWRARPARTSDVVRQVQAADSEGILPSPGAREARSRAGASGLGDHRSVFNIEVEGNHNYFAEGLLVHNCEEAQDLGDTVVDKSIMPMGASTNATRVHIGTPGFDRNYFYDTIQRLKGTGECFIVPWTEVVRQKREAYERDHQRFHLRYEKYVESEMRRLGPESDAFRTQYELTWLIERGMFVTYEALVGKCGAAYDPVPKGLLFPGTAYNYVPVYAGLDIAKTVDQTVLTVGSWVNPLTFMPDGDFWLYDWLELSGDNYEDQYDDLHAKLEGYKNVKCVCIDEQGRGAHMADKFRRSRFPVLGIETTRKTNNMVFQPFLDAVPNRHIFRFPMGAAFTGLESVRNLSLSRSQRRFIGQLTGLVKEYHGEQLDLHNKDDADDPHDDYGDSGALCYYGALTWREGGSAAKIGEHRMEAHDIFESGGMEGVLRAPPARELPFDAMDPRRVA